MFRAFWKNNFGLQDKYVAYWDKVAERLSPNKYVIGFDPFNEPLPSWNGIIDLLNTVFFGHFDKNDLAPLYTKIFNVIQKHNKDNIMYFEPGQFPDEAPGLVFNLGFKTPPGGQIGSSKHSLNDHTYCCQLNPEICAEYGEPQPKDQKKCYDWHMKRISHRNSDAEKLGVPLIFSEFGACMDSKGCAQEIQSVADISDMYLGGWAYWQYKPFKDLTTSAGNRSEGYFNNDGSVQVEKVMALNRAYVKAAQGTIKSMNFTSSGSNSGYFRSVIKIDSSIADPTELHAFYMAGSPITWYPHGFDVQVTNTDSTGPVPQVTITDRKSVV